MVKSVGENVTPKRVISRFQGRSTHFETARRDCGTKVTLDLFKCYSVMYGLFGQRPGVCRDLSGACLAAGGSLPKET